MLFLEYSAFGCRPDGLEVGKDGVEVNVCRGAKTHPWRCRLSSPSVRTREIDHPPEKYVIVKRLD